MFAYINNDYKFVIFWSPRCAHCSIHRILTELNLNFTPLNESIHHNDYKNYEKIKNYKQYVIYRNPYLRFISFFKNTLLHGETAGASLYDKTHPCRFNSIKSYLKFLDNLKLNIEEKINISEFHHCAPMFILDSYLINKDKAKFYNIDNNEFKIFVKEFLKNFSISNQIFREKLISKHEAKTINKNYNVIKFDTESLRLLHKLYSEDFIFYKKHNGCDPDFPP